MQITAKLRFRFASRMTRGYFLKFNFSRDVFINQPLVVFHQLRNLQCLATFGVQIIFTAMKKMHKIFNDMQCPYINKIGSYLFIKILKNILLT